CCRTRFTSCLPLRPPRATLFPYTTLFRSAGRAAAGAAARGAQVSGLGAAQRRRGRLLPRRVPRRSAAQAARRRWEVADHPRAPRSEEHTSELQSPDHLVCRLLLEKKKNER